MINLEQAISDWRREMRAAGFNDTEALDELESHLRTDAARFAASGAIEEEAFRLAVGRLGAPQTVRSEFGKINAGWNGPLMAGMAVWLVSGIGTIWHLSKMPASKPLRLLLCAHILSVVMGYLASFVAGTMGVILVECKMRGVLTSIRKHALARTSFVFNCLAAGLVLLAIILGDVWAAKVGKPELIPQEVAAWAVVVWMTASALAQRFGNGRSSRQAWMTIAGSALVVLAWFSSAMFVGQNGPAWGTLLVMAAVMGIFVALNFATASAKSQA